MVTNNWKSSDDCVANVGEFKLNKNKRKNKNTNLSSKLKKS